MTRFNTARLFSLAFSGLLALLPVQEASAQDAIDPEAKQVLAAMSDYLGRLASFSAKYNADFDVMTETGQKLKFAGSGDVAVQRPDKMRITRKGTIAKVDFILDGETLTIYGAGINRYLQLPATAIDEAITSVRDQTGLIAPGADLLTTKPLALDVTDVVSGEHIGMTSIGDVTVHHLAFRGREVDWQLWVQDGDEPLPVRYVITSKWQTGAPEYLLNLSDWDVASTFDPATFSFTPPADAMELPSLRFDETAQIMDTWE
jgi:hypothetical protein